MSHIDTMLGLNYLSEDVIIHKWFTIQRKITAVAIIGFRIHVYIQAHALNAIVYIKRRTRRSSYAHAFGRRRKNV